ncbi:hypothetical protein [Streptomyces sp. NPDC086787]|uniref:LexA family protein n=1 Tax=Streptomyces sp. NPDC086787 TaxID=3365759 RepID=UPI00382074B2
MRARPAHLTEREEQILGVVRRWITETGEGPTVRQIATETGLNSTATIAYHLRHLETERGALSRSGRSWRTCRLLR